MQQRNSKTRRGIPRMSLRDMKVWTAAALSLVLFTTFIGYRSLTSGSCQGSAPFGGKLQSQHHVRVEHSAEGTPIVREGLYYARDLAGVTIPTGMRSVDIGQDSVAVYKIPRSHPEDENGCGGLRIGKNNYPGVPEFVPVSPGSELCQLRTEKKSPLPNVYLDKSVPRERHWNAHGVFVHLAKSGGSTLKYTIKRAGMKNNFNVTTLTFNHRKVIEKSYYHGRQDYLDKLWPEGTWAMGGGTGNLHTVYDREISYVIMIREPVSRAISGYNYYRDVHDGHCAMIESDTTLVEYACWAANHTYNTMTTLPILKDMGRRQHDDTPPPFANVCDDIEFGHGEFQRYHCGTPTIADYDRILYELEHEYGLVLLTEDFDVGEQMLFHAYGMKPVMPMKINEKPKTRASCYPTDEELDKIAECLRFDIMVYEKAKQIYERQKAAFFEEVGGVVPHMDVADMGLWEKKHMDDIIP